MNFDVSKRTIYLCKHGSHAYGLSTPTSDLDIKGVCIAPSETYLGFLGKFEQQEQMVHSGYPEDKVIYCLRKFFKLAAEANPNIIEVLFCDDEDILSIDKTGERLRGIRDAFISKKARHTFSGYAHAQLKRIKTHRAWLLNPPKAPPARKDFHLSDDRSVSKSDLGAFTAYEELSDLAKAELIEVLPMSVVELLQREKAFANAKTTWEQYQNWAKSRNQTRAELEAKYGFDTKHGSHLIRLMRMCKEILEGKGVIVKRPDREYILAIKTGAMSYDEVVEESERLERECDELYKTSALQHKPDMNFLNSECAEMIENYLLTNG